MPYLLQGTVHDLAAVETFLKSLGVATSGLDYQVHQFETLGIDEARTLTERASTKPLGAPHRTFVCFFNGITTEAQNALLKTLEEPPAGALFVLVTSSPNTLLQTVRSRVRAHALPTAPLSHTDADAFLVSSKDERIKVITKLLDTDQREMGTVIEFLSSIERSLSKLNEKEALAAVYRARKYVTDKGSLLKPLLEQVALLTPLLKK
jgi:DNA polymerase III delta prime subunit